jgi:hypothetical protein
VLVEANEADDVAERRIGSRSAASGTIHAGGCPSTFSASWPPFSSSCSANSVTVEQGHGNGSITVMGCGGAMPVGEGMWGDEANAMRGEGARCSELEAKETKVMGAKC